MSRLPLPWAVVAMIANSMMCAAQVEAAIVTLLCFYTYFRPSEPFKLWGKHVVPPIAGAGAGHQHWALTLHPFELHGASKTQEFDESILLDRPEAVFLGPLLHRLALAGRMELPLFSLTQAEFGRAFRAVSEKLGLLALGTATPYQLRHAGASWDFAAGTRTLAEVQRRGRWRAAASVRRYEKGGRISEQLNKLPAAVRIHAVKCSESIASVVSGTRLPLAEP